MKNHFWGVLVLLTAMIGCDFPIGEQVERESLKGKVMIGVSEQYGRYDQPSDPALTISLRSEDIFGCLNYHIDHSFTIRGSVLEISNKGASVGPICLTAIGLASAALKPHLTNGRYLLNISMGGRTDAYDFEISESALRLTPHDTVISRPTSRLVWRYPPQSFAQIHVQGRSGAELSLLNWRNLSYNSRRFLN